jgi:hypothetical protein
MLYRFGLIWQLTMKNSRSPRLQVNRFFAGRHRFEQFVINHKQQQHPDRVEPPNSKDVQMQQTDISDQTQIGLLRQTLVRETVIIYWKKRCKEDIAAVADILLPSEEHVILLNCYKDSTALTC